MKLITFLATLFLLAGCNLSHPSDEELNQLFSSNEKYFIELSNMIENDKNIVRLSFENVFYLDYSKEKISEDRLKKYRSLLTKLDLKDGIHRDNANSVRFIASTKGFPVSSSEKSFLYTTKKVQPLVVSIDSIIKNNNGDQKPVYKRIVGNWYLTYESW